MPEVTTVYRREDLYNEVWAEPVSQVAKRYGVSGVALAKICRRLDVPTPARGYWTKKALGKEVRQPPLPPARNGVPAECRVMRCVAPPGGAGEESQSREQQVEPPALDLPFRIEVAPSLKRPHRLVSETGKQLRTRQMDRSGLVSSGDSEVVEVVVSRPQVSRALRILDALLKGAEKAGHEVRPAAGLGKPACIVVDGEQIWLKMRERVVQSDAPGNPDAARYSLLGQRFYRPTGELRLRIGSQHSYGSSGEWRDKQAGALETKVNEIFKAILDLSPEIKATRARYQETARQYEAEAQRLRAAEEERLREQRWAEGLVEQSQNWRRADVLRQFIKAVQAQASERSALVDGKPVDGWAREALRVADQLDPLHHLLGPLSGGSGRES